ncbi:MAG: DUF342 domain-containing protein [Thermodesulfobacteriota bacterium]
MENFLAGKKVALDEGESDLVISDDKLQAFISLAGEESSFDSLNWPELWNKVREQGVVYGLLEEPEQVDAKTVLIARGKPPESGKDAFFQIVVKTGTGSNVSNDGKKTDSRVDHRELGHIVNVRKGQLLLKKIVATEGEPGKDVFGNEIKVKKGKDRRLKAGKGVELSEDGMEARAAVQGEFILNDKKPFVYEEHEINGDIDLSTGNVRFSGVFLRISGQILPGFRVECLGSITIGQGVNNATVISDKSVTINGGVVGSDSVIKALESIKVDFCENTGLLETKGDLELTDFIVQGHVRVGRDIKALQGKGAIIGGDCIAGGSIYSLELGSDGEAVTRVTAGMNTVIEKRKAKIEQIRKTLRPKLNEYLKSINTLSEMKKEQGKAFTEDNARALASMNKILPKLTDKDSALCEKEEELEQDIKKGLNQRVYVFGILYPGVKVTIANVSRVIDSMESSVVLEYMKKQQKIHIRPLTDEEKQRKIPDVS